MRHYRIRQYLRPRPTPDMLVLPPAGSEPSLHQDPGLAPLEDHGNNRLGDTIVLLKHPRQEHVLQTEVISI